MTTDFDSQLQSREDLIHESSQRLLEVDGANERLKSEKESRISELTQEIRHLEKELNSRSQSQNLRLD